MTGTIRDLEDLGGRRDFVELSCEVAEDEDGGEGEACCVGGFVGRGVVVSEVWGEGV